MKNELLVDNFAGGGGASLGIEQAFGRPVDIAINHDPEAISMHITNHPDTSHFCENVWDVDPREATGGKPVRLAWFSPDCKHFSKAKGGKPVEKNIRGLAWVALKWAATVKPSIIILENVEEFKDWGPLTSENKPCPDSKGRTYESFCNALRRHGYKVEDQELRACDYGAPTIRKRLFLIARRDGMPIVWPEPTHGPGRPDPYRTAADIIDWSIPCPSIFTRKRPLAENTMRRIARGIQRFVIDTDDPFIAPAPVVAPFITEHANASSQRNMKIDEPLRTICAQTKGGHFALVAPTLIQTGYGEREGQKPRVPGLDKPLGTVVAGGVKHALIAAFVAKHFGGATGAEITRPFPTILSRGTQNQLVTASLQRHFGNSVGSSVEAPVGTVTAGGAGKTSLVTSHMIKLRGTCKDGQDMRQPAPTVTAGGLHMGEVRAFLMKYYGDGGQWQDPRDPLHTVPTRARFGLVTVHGEEYQIVDIGMRMLTPRELFRAQGFPEDYIIDLDHNGKRLTKAAQVRMCGNSVCPPVARAVVEANIEQLQQRATA